MKKIGNRMRTVTQQRTLLTQIPIEMVLKMVTRILTQMENWMMMRRILQIQTLMTEEEQIMRKYSQITQILEIRRMMLRIPTTMEFLIMWRIRIAYME